MDFDPYYDDMEMEDEDSFEDLKDYFDNYEGELTPEMQELYELYQRRLVLSEVQGQIIINVRLVDFI